MQTEIINIIPMTECEARECVDAIKQNLSSTRELAYSFYIREGWKSLGYRSWRECVVVEFEQNQSTLYFQLQAAQIESNISNALEIGTIPMRHLRPLAQLEPEQQRDAWQQATETAPNGKMTEAHVQSVVDKIQNKPRPESIHVSDDSYEWYTPEEYITAARSVLGGIDLDPASTAKANEIIKATTFYTKEQNGLSQPWLGRVWLNPPYNMPWVEQFTGKTIEEYETGNIECAIILVNNATDTNWFHRLINYPFCLTKGRVQFWADDGSVLATRQGQALFYLGSNLDLFTREFNIFGDVVRKI